jgi:hypothetical protein
MPPHAATNSPPHPVSDPVRRNEKRRSHRVAAGFGQQSGDMLPTFSKIHLPKHSYLPFPCASRGGGSCSGFRLTQFGTSQPDPHPHTGRPPASARKARQADTMSKGSNGQQRKPQCVHS